MKNWTRIEKKSPYLKVYLHKKTGNVRIVYPKAPKWAQHAALLIYKDLEDGGMPTKKGVSDIVLGTWAKMISELEKER